MNGDHFLSADSDYCATVAEMTDMDPSDERRKAPHKVRHGVARDAMEFVRLHGAEYPDKASAMAAFKAQQLADRAKVGAGYSGENVHVYGFGILLMVFVELCVWFFERWWAKRFPNT